MKMNQEVKAKWLTALRSGEYKQTQYSLKDNQGFCCLGVLCDVYSKEFPEFKWEFDAKLGRYRFDREYTSLPSEVGAWAGILANHGDAPVILSDEEADIRSRNSNLMDLNDDLSFDFNQIADIIEAQL
jgi:hypothetical protein